MSEILANKITPVTGTTVTLGDSGDTFTIPSGVTVANSGTATGFGADTSLSNLAAAGGQQVVKMWINFNGTGTVAIRDSYNVTSITDNGTGDYAVTIDTDFANINYSIMAPASWITTGGPEHHIVLNRVNTSGAEYAPTVTSFRMTTSHGGTMTDAKYVYASAFGD
jgi:hypothetical protein